MSCLRDTASAILHKTTSSNSKLLHTKKFSNIVLRLPYGLSAHHKTLIWNFLEVIWMTKMHGEMFRKKSLFKTYSKVHVAQETQLEVFPSYFSSFFEATTIWRQHSIVSFLRWCKCTNAWCTFRLLFWCTARGAKFPKVFTHPSL